MAKKYLNAAGAALIAAMLGGALSEIFLSSLGMSVSWELAFGWAAGLALLLSVARLGKPGAACACLLGAAGLFLPFLWNINPFSEAALALGELGRFGQEGGGALLTHAGFFAAVASLAFTAVMYWMAGMVGGVFPAMTLSLIVLLGGWFVEGAVRPVYCFLIVAALGAMLARSSDDKTHYLRALPLAALAALIAVSLTPAGRLTYPPLEEAAQKVRELFDDYFLFTDPRTTYSISSDGYQSRGEILGGPARPEERLVMEVETAETVLLRGSVKRNYTGYSWTESAVNNRYLFIDPMRKGLRDQIFDADRFEGLDFSGAFQSASGKVTMLGEGISALFVPHRLRDMTLPIDLASYFSSTGEVFITRGVQAGDSYAYEALIPTEDAGRMLSLLERARAGGDARYREQQTACLSLPGGVEQGVYDLTQSVVGGAETPYERAFRIQDYLVKNYVYEQEVPYPPQNRDFVSYFLLDAKTGYCSYFASAMAVMARIAGLPSRYCEGYLVPAQASGTSVVSGKNAHAWVEIYFEGAGWISFNPTPGSGASYDGGGGGSQGTDGEAPEEEGDSGQKQTDEPEATPTPAPADESDNGEDSASDTSGDAGGEQEPEPSPSPEPEPEAENPPEDQPPPRAFPWLILLLLAAAAALTAFCVLRLRKSDPARLTKDRRGAVEKLMIYYRAILLSLDKQGQAPENGETPEAFAARLSGQKLAGEEFVYVTKQLTLTAYGGRKPETAALRQAALCYERFAAQLRPSERLRWLLHRIVKGLGSWKKIP